MDATAINSEILQLVSFNLGNEEYGRIRHCNIGVILNNSEEFSIQFIAPSHSMPAQFTRDLSQEKTRQ